MKTTDPAVADGSVRRVLNERYELLEVLGSGGMGTVHRALDLRLGRQVAVKLLRTSGHNGSDHRRRLEAEATIAASLRHPSIAQVYDHDEDRDSPDRTPFVVMEIVEGVTLARLLRDRGALSWEETLALVRHVASALAHLQAHGVIHRDLKPANIMLTTDGRVVLVDFGIARAESSTAMTTTGALLGTVEYLSPEQIGGASGTASSDLYALGLVAHGCLTGSSPFRRSSHIATAWAQVNDDLPQLPESVPPVVRGIVTTLAAKTPADRPADAATVVRVIDDLGLKLELPPVVADDVPVAPGPDADRNLSMAVTAPFARRRPRWATAGWAAAAAVVVALLLTGERSPSVAEPPASTVDAEPTPIASEPVPAETEPVVVADTVSVEPVAPAAPTAGANPNGNGSTKGKGNANGNGNGKGKSK